MSIGKSSIERAVNATAAVKSKSGDYSAARISNFSVDDIGILTVALTPENTEVLKQSIEKRGVLCPVLVCVTAKGDAWLIDGYRRLYAARELGISQINATVISVQNKSEANRIYSELAKTKQFQKENSIHEEKFRAIDAEKHSLPVYLL